MPLGKVFDLGRQGDGLIKSECGNVFVAGVLPDETVEYEIIGGGRARLTGVRTPSPDRAVPLCPCFGECGGCVLQHLNADAYRRFKLRFFKETLSSIGDLPEFDEPFFAPINARRRAGFAVYWNGRTRRFGFNARQSDRIVEMERCPVLVPALSALIQPLRAFICDAGRAYPKKAGVGDAYVLMTEVGADIFPVYHSL